MLDYHRNYMFLEASENIRCSGADPLTDPVDDNGIIQTSKWDFRDSRYFVDRAV